MRGAGDINGKVCLVTGANSGIGKATAIGLGKMGATVVMVCRNKERGEAAAKEVVSKTGNKSVSLLMADLLSQAEIRRLAREFESAFDRLHVLVNNAGSYFPNYGTSEDGIERTFALNSLAPFLLTNLLLDRMKAGAPSRVVNVSSVAHYSGWIRLEDLNGQKGYRGTSAYSRSKLVLVLFTKELARRLEGSGVTANSLHPGAIRTNIWQHTGIFSPLTLVASRFMRGPGKGAETVLFLASSPDVEGVSGKYFDDMKERRSARAAQDEELARQLWSACERLTGLARK